MSLTLPRRSLLLTAVIAVLAVVLAILVVPGRATATSTAASTMEWEFFAKLNAYRAQNGRAPLQMSTAAVGVARSWSATMARADDLYHNPDMVGDLERIAPNYRTLGENVGYGWSVDSLHDAFVHSPGHRANIVDSRFDYVGIGVVLTGTKIWVTVDFIDTRDRLNRSYAPSATGSAPETITAAPAPLNSSVFVRLGNGRTVRSGYSHGRLSGAENLGGVTPSAPASTTYGRSTAVAVRGTNNSVYLRTGTPGHYTGWRSLGGKTYHAPALAGDSSGRLDVFATGTNRALYVRSYIPGHGWGRWHSLGGVLSTGPGAVTTRSGHTDVFGAGRDHAVWTRSRVGSRWGRWHSLGGRTPSAPAAAYATATGQEMVTVRGTNNAVYTRQPGHGGWHSLGGRTYDAPGAGASGTGLAIAVRGTDNRVYSRTLGTSGWSSRWVRG